jgi:hypothetical protein
MNGWTLISVRRTDFSVQHQPVLIDEERQSHITVLVLHIPKILQMTDIRSGAQILRSEDTVKSVTRYD